MTATEDRKGEGLEAQSAQTGVLFLLNALRVGGSEAKIVRVVNALRERERPVHLGCLNGSSQLMEAVDDRVPTVDFRRQGKFDPRVPSRIGEFIRLHRISALFCVNLYPTLYGALAQALSRGGVTCVSFINTTDFPSVSEALKMVVYAPALRRASKLVFGCRNQRELWISRYRLPPERCTHIYNGVDLAHFAPGPFDGKREALRKDFGFSPREVVIVSVAQFRPGKKQEDLVAACALLARRGHPVRLALVGDGPERSRVQGIAERMGVADRVRFFGQLDDVRPVLSAGDLFALSSVAVETFSNAALEAMAMGLPAVLSEIGGAAEMVEEGVNGLLYPAGDVGAVAEKLLLLVRDAEMRERMSLEARRVVRERFGFEAMVREYEKLVLLPQSPPAPERREGAGAEPGRAG